MTVDPFDGLVPKATAYLRDLAANNNKDWFQQNKSDYDDLIKKPGKAIGAIIAAELETLTGKTHTTKLFRPNRDVRFSKDKTPYQTHMHLLWSSGDGPGWFFGIAQDYVTAGCGVMAFEKASLDSYRKYVDQNGSKLVKLLKKLEKAEYRLDKPDLKRVPAPYDKDHIHGELLRHKSLAIWKDVSGDGSPHARISKAFKALKPVYDICNEITGNA